MNTHRRAVSSFLAFTALATAAACSTPDPEPTPTLTQPPTVMADPTITWIDGIAPSSPLEADPAVQAARAAEIGRAMAFNTGDFTIAQLTDNSGPRVIDFLADAHVRQQPPWVYFGPDPWEPLRVEHTDDGITITVCAIYEVSDSESSPNLADIASPYDRSNAHTETIVVRGAAHELKVTNYQNWNSTPCDGQSVPIGLFDPEPVPSDAPITQPVRPPDGWTPGKPRE